MTDHHPHETPLDDRGSRSDQHSPSNSETSDQSASVFEEFFIDGPDQSVDSESQGVPPANREPTRTEKRHQSLSAAPPRETREWDFFDQPTDTETADFEPPATGDRFQINHGDQVLVRGPSEAPTTDDVWSQLLETDSAQDALIISPQQTLDRRLQPAYQRIDGTIRAMSLETDAKGSNKLKSQRVQAATDSTSVHLRRLDPRSGLARLGIATTQMLAAFDDPSEVVVCFDGLKALPPSVGEKKVFRFIALLRGRFKLADATSCYVVDPATNEDIEPLIRGLFETVVDTADGQIAVVE